MKTLLLLSLFNQDFCHQIIKDYKLVAELETISEEIANYSPEEWMSLPVLFDFQYEECIPTQAVQRSLMRTSQGDVLEMVTTNEDSCDGGNSYGFIRRYPSKEVIAHIYDYDFYCQEDWRNK
jgi:hypothetical protein